MIAANKRAAVFTSSKPLDRLVVPLLPAVFPGLARGIHVERRLVVRAAQRTHAVQEPFFGAHVVGAEDRCHLELVVGPPPGALLPFRFVPGQRRGRGWHWGGQELGSEAQPCIVIDTSTQTLDLLDTGSTSTVDMLPVSNTIRPLESALPPPLHLGHAHLSLVNLLASGDLPAPLMAAWRFAVKLGRLSGTSFLGNAAAAAGVATVLSAAAAAACSGGCNDWGEWQSAGLSELCWAPREGEQRLRSPHDYVPAGHDSASWSPSTAPCLNFCRSHSAAVQCRRHWPESTAGSQWRAGVRKTAAAVPIFLETK